MQSELKGINGAISRDSDRPITSCRNLHSRHAAWLPQLHKACTLGRQPGRRGATSIVARAVEDDPRYRRVDLSALHAYEARQSFAAELSKGEGGINLAQAALHVAAEDDALVSHSTVKLPVAQFLKRIDTLSEEIARVHLNRLQDASEPTHALEVVQDRLFNSTAFRLPSYGRSNVPSHSVVDHPGVWENPAQAYLNEVLIRKTGIAASLAIIYAQVMQNLLLSGAVNFAVRIDCSQMDRLPVARILKGISPEALVRPDGSVLNTCSTDALVEMLRYLKRSFWPFPWQTAASHSEAEWTGGSGFGGAAEVALDGVGSADLEAISRTAKHRLDRGIWTSTGAGDLRRAVAASERLCLLVGDEAPWERRDAAVLLLHAGKHSQAAAELKAYRRSEHFRGSAPTEERELVSRLHSWLGQQPDLDERCEPMSVESTLVMPPPTEEQALPLTW